MITPPSILQWLTLCLCTSVMAQMDDGDVVDLSQIPMRPVGQILDAARWFSRAEKESAQSELDRLFKENDIDVYLVTSEKNPPQGPKTYARKLGEAWSRAPVWCVVFHVPGEASGFHVEAGGVEMAREKIDRAVDEACRRARKENTEKDRVMAAWRECSEGLRFVHASGKLHNDRVVKVRKEMVADYVWKQKLKKIIPVAAIGALIILTAMVCFVMRTIRAKRFSFVFPDTTWRTRFQGPHSGGGGIVVNYHGKKLT